MQHRLARAVVCALTVLASAAQADLVVTSRVLLSTLPKDIGGLSAIDVAADGATAHMLSDRGTLYSGEIERNADGVLTGFTVTNRQRLRHDGEHRHPDSEGLVFADQGVFFVSGEDPTRVMQYQMGNKFPRYFRNIPSGPDLTTNRGFEALAQDQSGALYTFFEDPDAETGAFPMYRLKDGVWDIPRQIKVPTDFAIVGADFAPDGRLFLLLRAFSALGFRTQIVHLDPADASSEPVTVFSSALGEFDNLEGLAVWQDNQDKMRIIAVSDNNFLSVLRSEMVEFVLNE